jgi:hypothetical protein
MHRVDEIQNALPAVAKVKGSTLPIETRVEDELAKWEGLVESDSQAQPLLSKYWEGVNYPGWTPDVPWSAAFISWVLAPYNFQGQPSHVAYTESVLNEESPGWMAYSIPKNQGNIKLQPGDVLIRKRTSSDTASHGDVVYKIADGTAWLAGGNLSNTAKVAATIPVDKKGYASNISDYQIILKPGGSYLPEKLVGGLYFGLYAAWLGYLAVQHKRG